MMVKHFTGRFWTDRKSSRYCNIWEDDIRVIAAALKRINRLKEQRVFFLKGEDTGAQLLFTLANLPMASFVWRFWACPAGWPECKLGSRGGVPLETENSVVNANGLIKGPCELEIRWCDANKWHKYANDSSANLFYTHEAQGKYVSKICLATEVWDLTRRRKNRSQVEIWLRWIRGGASGRYLLTRRAMNFLMMFLLPWKLSSFHLDSLVI